MLKELLASVNTEHLRDRFGNPIWNPDFQLRKFCNTYSNKKIEIFPAVDYNMYQNPDVNLYEFISDDCDLILFDTTYFPNSTEQCYSWINSLKLNHPFAYLTANFSHFDSPDSNIIYFPFYYFQLLENPEMRTYDIRSPRPYYLQCLNLNPWLHRTINVIQLSQKPWFNKTLTSFHWLNPPNNIPPTNIVNHVLSNLTSEETAILNQLPLPLTINLTGEPDLHGWIYIGNASRAHELAYIDYVTESGITEKFVSEKIWKPFFSGQLPLCLGPCGIMKHLNTLGLDTFDDIIDHQRYDSIQGSSPKDIRDKVTAILDIVDNLLVQGLDKIWTDTYERRNYNLQLVLSKEFQYKILSKLINTIS